MPTQIPIVAGFALHLPDGLVGQLLLAADVAHLHPQRADAVAVHVRGELHAHRLVVLLCRKRESKRESISQMKSLINSSIRTAANKAN